MPAKRTQVAGWSCRLRPTPGTSWTGSIPRAPQFVRGADPGAEQHERRPVGAAGEDDSARLDAVPGAAVDQVDGGGPTAGHLDPVDDRVAGDAEVRPVADRVEIGKRRVPAHALGDVERPDPDAELGIDVVDRGQEREAGRRGGVEAGAVPGRHLLPGRLEDAHRPVGRDETGPQRLHVPTVVPGRRPGVVVGAVPPNGRAAVVRRAAADHPRPLETQLRGAVGGGAEVAPGVAGDRHRPVGEQIGGPGAARPRPVVRTGFEQQDRFVRRRGEPPGHHRPGHPAADHDRLDRPRQRRVPVRHAPTPPFRLARVRHGGILSGGRGGRDGSRPNAARLRAKPGRNAEGARRSARPEERLSCCCGRRRPDVYACLPASTSSAILTVSPTRRPPASSATFQPRSNSLRLIWVRAL